MMSNPVSSDNGFDRFFTKEFIKCRRVFPRCLTSVRKTKYTHRRDLVAPRQGYFVASFHCMRRLGNVAIDGNPTSFANSLGYRSARAKAACFEEEVETHNNGVRFRVSDIRLVPADTWHLTSVLWFRKDSQQLALLLLRRFRRAPCLHVSVVGHLRWIQLQEWRNCLAVVF